MQPVVTLFVQQLTGPRPDIATLGGLAFSVTGMAGMVAVPLLGRRSDQIGYRRVLLICLLGATLTSLPQGFAISYWDFTAERFGVGLFIGGILPAANALIGRMVARSDRGLVYGMSSSAMFLGNSMGPLTGGFIAASFGLRWVFVVTASLLAGEPRVGVFQGGRISEYSRWSWPATTCAQATRNPTRSSSSTAQVSCRHPAPVSMPTRIRR